MIFVSDARVLAAWCAHRQSDQTMMRYQLPFGATAKGMMANVGLTRFGGHPEAFARGVPDAQVSSTLFA